ncbi:energy transducer TonB [Methylacidiphilum kamchatkense]|uniref:TonB family protein n=1 Tax=Methylacidiphilum kamchatkense Kam1 TaxID=1202785 RepID=A0A516TNV7_9BACT|nr:energy transducer TonB [Methylacidiphilum kamchatkense]QDQ42910.1 TonB family protein [Methylacidiphilum kamchatkense Kam1]
MQIFTRKKEKPIPQALLRKDEEVAIALVDQPSSSLPHSFAEQTKPQDPPQPITPIKTDGNTTHPSSSLVSKDLGKYTSASPKKSKKEERLAAPIDFSNTKELNGSRGLVSYHLPVPPYPLLARLNHMQGKVVLRITVHNGKVIASTIVKSSGYSLLDQTAKYWVETHWQFPEGLKKVFLEEIIFELEEENDSPSLVS